MIVSIAQPAYLPWMGYFERIRKSDVHVVLDTVQFEKGSFINRNMIENRSGLRSWLTLPVRQASSIASMTIAEGAERFVEKNVRTLEQNFSHPLIGPLVCTMRQARSGDPLVPHLLAVTSTITHALNFWRPTVLASDCNPVGAKSDLVLDICKKTGATTYLSGVFGRTYLDLDAFAAAGIKVVFDEEPRAEWIGVSAVDLIARGKA